MRLIDADALIAELEKDEEMFDREAEDGKQNPQNCTAGYAEAMWSRANGIRDAIISIYDAPTVDAVEKKVDVVRCKDCKKVEVVRCRECKHWDTDWKTREGCEDKHWCNFIDLITDVDFYCKHGKRKDKDE